MELLVLHMVKLRDPWGAHRAHKHVRDFLIKFLGVVYTGKGLEINLTPGTDFLLLVMTSFYHTLDVI